MANFKHDPAEPHEHQHADAPVADGDTEEGRTGGDPGATVAPGGERENDLAEVDTGTLEANPADVVEQQQDWR